MQIHPDAFPTLAQHVARERRSQGLSREQAAAVCNVSTSFIRDAESNPGRCSLAKMVLLTQGLGLTLAITGFTDSAPPLPPKAGASA